MTNKTSHTIAALARLAARNFQSVNAVRIQEGLSVHDMTIAKEALQKDRVKAVAALGAIAVSALAIPKVGWVLSFGTGAIAAVVGARATFTDDYSREDRAVLNRAIRNKRRQTRLPELASQ